MATENFGFMLGLFSNSNWEGCLCYICGRERREFQLETENSNRIGSLEFCSVLICIVWP